MNIKKINWWFGSGPSYGPDVTAYVAKLNALGYTVPSGTELAAINSLMISLRTRFPTEQDTVNIYGFGSLQAGTVNIEDPETHQHTFPAGNPTYTAGQGVKSDGVGTYINTQYAVNEYGGIETSLTTIVYVSENSTVFNANQSVIGSRGKSASTDSGTRLVPLSTASVGSRRGYATSDNFTSTNHKGLYILTYNGTQSVLYKDYDGVLGIKDTQVVTPTAPDIANKVFLLARNSNGAGGSTPSDFYPYNTALLIRLRKQITDADAIAIKGYIDTFRGSVGLATFVIAAGVWDFTGVFSFSGTWIF